MLEGVLAVSIFWGSLGYLAYSSGAYNGAKSYIKQSLKSKQMKMKKKMNSYQRYMKGLIKREQIVEDSSEEENIRNDNNSMTQKSSKLELKVSREDQLFKTKPIHKRFKGKYLTEYREWMSSNNQRKNREEEQRISDDEEQKVVSSKIQKILPDDINDEILEQEVAQQNIEQKEEQIKYNPFASEDDDSQI